MREKIRTNIAPKVEEKLRMPACVGLSPNPIWNSNGRRNGVASSPMRQIPPVTVPMWKVLMLKRLRSRTGEALCLAWCA